MNPFLVACVIVLSVTIAATLYRIWAGPTVFDRLVSVALVSVNGVVLLVLLGVVLERPELFFDIALGFALLAFLLPIALGRYFERGSEDRAVGTGDPEHPDHDHELQADDHDDHQADHQADRRPDRQADHQPDRQHEEGPA